MTNASTPIEYFKKEAKKLFRQVQAGEAGALDRINKVLKDSENISLMRVQHVIAVESGYPKWESLSKATVVELQKAISRVKSSDTNDNETPINFRVPPPGETPLVSFLRGPFDGPTAPHLEVQKIITPSEIIFTIHLTYGELIKMKHGAD